MNLLISDYDGTLKSYDNNPNIIEKETFKKNINAINKFIDNGNKFVIATGRSTDSIKDEIEKYNINYTYLMTYNGRTILDKEENVIYANYLQEELIKCLLKNKELIKCLDLYNEYGYTKSNENIIYIKLSVKDIKEIKKILIELQKEYPELKIDCNNILKRMIIRNDFNKRLGIEELLNREKIIIPKKQIITVGDEVNDIDMIHEYNGYKMLISNPQLLFVTNKTTTSIHRLIKKLNIY